MNGELEWRDGEPWSVRYGDVFFARGSGLVESRHVFLEGNRLAGRFASLAPGAVFTIGETGFGTGLNFLAAWRLFIDRAPQGALFAYVSAELHPLARSDLVRALALWPELAAEARQLVDHWQDFVPGFHRLAFADGRVSLTLLIGDAQAMLAALHARIDAWFLDGFAPDRNPRMWSPELVRELARCSHAGTTLATYSVAGTVRRELEAAGFAVGRTSGHGRKREMLVGKLDRALPAARGFPTTPGGGARSVAVIGAGLAGAAAAASLAARGCSVTVFDRHATIAAEASGNAQGILYVRLSRQHTPLRQLLLSSYQHTLRALPDLLSDGEQWRQCGVLQLAFDADEARRQAALAREEIPASVLQVVGEDHAVAAAGVPVPTGGLLFPGGGWVHPPALCAALLDHTRIECRLGRAVRSVAPHDGAWMVESDNGERFKADAVILATAFATQALVPEAGLPLRAVSGQITMLPATSASSKLRVVICARGYVAPPREHIHTLGATHRMNEASTDVRAVDHGRNLERLRTLAPELARAFAPLDLSSLEGRGGVRCTSPDTLPIVGALDPRGLHVTTAHGTRGLVTTLLAGELLASQIAGEPAPLPAALIRALSPARFVRAHGQRGLWHHRAIARTEGMP